MPISIADLAKERRDLSVGFGRLGSIDITYKPNVLTPAREAEIRRLAEQDDMDLDEDDADDEGVSERREGADDATLVLLLDLLESWDLMGPLHNAEGEELVPLGIVVPLNLECLRFVSSKVQMRLLREIGKDNNPDPNGKGKSGGRSRRED